MPTPASTSTCFLSRNPSTISQDISHCPSLSSKPASVALSIKKENTSSPIFRNFFFLSACPICNLSYSSQKNISAPAFYTLYVIRHIVYIFPYENCTIISLLPQVPIFSVHTYLSFTFSAFSALVLQASPVLPSSILSPSSASISPVFFLCPSTCPYHSDSSSIRLVHASISAS